LSGISIIECPLWISALSMNIPHRKGYQSCAYSLRVGGIFGMPWPLG
jgi:hypothetical protein